MIVDFISRALVVLLGYAYPAFECYKTVERNSTDVEQLCFWCRYWIIIALLTVFERFGDVFVSWLPLYGEMKLAFIIYLWYPKTMGTTYMYETFLRPNVARYETDIDQVIGEFKAKAWNMAIFHVQNSLKFGQTTFLQFLQYLANQSTAAQEPQKPNLLVSRSPPNDTVHVQEQASEAQTPESYMADVIHRARTKRGPRDSHPNDQ
ncbi:hypothetical protein Syun_002478 [Stephania yunnanensis]|uniref:HVA22-like protein n=1 Tax=Stephania yunnanensis TaxID=152371 RepID=A0AAP0LFI1_9MAGN